MNILPSTRENIERAGGALRDGRLVVIPTETVYGLAADALDPVAVRRIFEAKGRPGENPLIVHLASAEGLQALVTEVPDAVGRLAALFWPGPLTLVLKKRLTVPSETTGGLDTVAVRVPGHPVARAVVNAAGRPIAAPSANPFMALSPTRAQHVEPAIAEAAEFILDGGPCEIGLESTVLDLSGAHPRILRPGRISREDLEAVLGLLSDAEPEVRRSPGSYPRHYAPRTPLRLVIALGPSDAGLTFGSPDNVNQIAMPETPDAYASVLYEALHTLDARNLTQILVESPPEEPAWEAVYDRLKKAAHPA